MNLYWAVIIPYFIKKLDNTYDMAVNKFFKKQFSQTLVDYTVPDLLSLTIHENKILIMIKFYDYNQAIQPWVKRIINNTITLASK